MSNINSSNQIISVVITTFNRFEKCKRAINSVLDQTYPQTELIVVEDSSDSGVKRWILENKISAKYIRNNKNLGLSASRNIGIKSAKGDWIAFLDDDDELVPKSLELKINKLKRLKIENKSVAVVYSGANIHHKDYGNIFYHKPRITGKISKYVKKGDLNTIPSSGLYNKILISKIGGFDENLKSFIDHDFWLNMAQSNYSAIYIDKPLVRTYVSKEKNSMVTNVDHRIEAIEIFLNKWDIYLRELMGDLIYINYVKKYKENVIGNLMFRALELNSYKDFKKCFSYLANENGYARSCSFLLLGGMRYFLANIYHTIMR